jgi:hypothetical protein
VRRHTLQVKLCQASRQIIYFLCYEKLSLITRFSNRIKSVCSEIFMDVDFNFEVF